MCRAAVYLLLALSSTVVRAEGLQTRDELWKVRTDGRLRVDTGLVVDGRAFGLQEPAVAGERHDQSRRIERQAA
jgi:hypothetical protein